MSSQRLLAHLLTTSAGHSFVERARLSFSFDSEEADDFKRECNASHIHDDLVCGLQRLAVKTTIASEIREQAQELAARYGLDLAEMASEVCLAYWLTGERERAMTIAEVYRLGEPVDTLVGLEADLHRATFANNVDWMRSLLGKGAKVDALVGSAGSDTPLLKAAFLGRVEALRLLVSQGANLEARNADGSTALMFARLPAVVQVMVGAGADPDALDGDGYSVLVRHITGHGMCHHSRKDGREERCFFNDRMPPVKRGCGGAGERNPEWLNLRDTHSALNKYNIGRYFMRYGGPGEIGLRLVDLLLEAGANPRAAGKHGVTALMAVAAVHGDAGADLVKRLLSADPGLLELGDEDGWTALMWAAWQGNRVVVEALMTYGASAEGVDEHDRTALMLAAASGGDAVLDLLVDGSQIDREDCDGWTALMWAAWEGHDVVVDRLLKEGARLDWRDRERRTALMWAAGYGRVSTVRLLLERGAKGASVDESGRSAGDLARDAGYPEVVDMLEQCRCR